MSVFSSKHMHSRALHISTLLVCFALTGCLHRNNFQSYAGTWVLKSSGENLMVLTTKVHHTKLRGTLEQPKHHTEDWNGSFSGVSLPLVSLPVIGKCSATGVRARLISGHDSDTVTMTLTDHDHLLLDRYRGIVPPWKFERVSNGQAVRIATDWPVFNADPEIEGIRQRLRELSDQDKTAREESVIDPNKLEQLSQRSRSLLQNIFDTYGWPKISIFGTQACNDFWLLVQHEPLQMQEEMLPALKRAVETGAAQRRNYAYLYDRVQVEKREPQYWGTQSICEHGKAILATVDDVEHIDKRRAAIGLEPLSQSLAASEEVCKRLHN
jgi:hypothetical protein